MPRDDRGFAAAQVLPPAAEKEKDLAAMLPYVSLVDDVTIRTRGNELFQCIRLDGINSFTTDDALLDRTKELLASVVAQVGAEFSFYVHKVSKAIDHGLRPISGEGFAAAVDDAWRQGLAQADLRDRTLTLTVIKRPPLSSRVPFLSRMGRTTLASQTERQMLKLGEVVGFLLSSYAGMRPRLLSARRGELLGFLAGLNTGRERPLFPGSRFGYLAQDVANTRATFRGAVFELSEGTAGNLVGTSFAIKNYPPKTSVTMFDELSLPVDMVVTHSFTPINSNIMAGRIKRQQRLMRASEDGAVSLLEELDEALDDLESKRLSFGDHHMTVTVFASDRAQLDVISGEIRNIAASTGVNLINEPMAARTHYFAQHPGNMSFRSRKAAVAGSVCSRACSAARMVSRGVGTDDSRVAANAELRARDFPIMFSKMRVSDMMTADGRVFLKSEWGQISDGWPCVSFTKRSVGDRLRREFVAGRDILVYVGTTSTEMTRLPEHRSRLISAVTIEPNQILETRKIVPPQVWASSNAQWGDRWPHSMAVLAAANLIGPPYPAAHDVIPTAYRSFAEIANRGAVVEAIGAERQAVMALEVEPITLNLREDVQAYLKLRSSVSMEIEPSIKQDAYRMAMLIIERVKSGGEIGVKINPLRSAPNLSELNALLIRKWGEQAGQCALCGGALTVGGGNKMLQPSADRTDSANGAYDDANIAITHLACNLAKNKYGMDDFEDWLSVLRGVDLQTGG